MIENGEYVRLQYGKIDKVKDTDYYMQQYIECEKGLYPKENIVKHSKNIIDLIEYGDIVVLEYYVRKYGKRISRKFEIENLDNKVIYFDNRHCSFCYDLEQDKWRDGKGYNPKIKSIVTKEQFKAIAYKV